MDLFGSSHKHKNKNNYKHIPVSPTIFSTWTQGSLQIDLHQELFHFRFSPCFFPSTTSIYTTKNGNWLGCWFSRYKYQESLHQGSFQQWLCFILYVLSVWRPPRPASEQPGFLLNIHFTFFRFPAQIAIIVGSFQPGFNCECSRHVQIHSMTEWAESFTV